MTLTLSQLAILLGIGIGLPQIWAVAKPVQAAAAIRKLPRSEAWGYLLMAIGAGWFLYRLNQEAIAERFNIQCHSCYFSLVWFV